MNTGNPMKQFAAVSACVALWAGACDSNPTAPPRVAMVAVAPAQDTITAGASVQLTATPKDAAGKAIAGLAVTWSSDNPAAATVSDAGLVQGVSSGVAQIIATTQEKSGSAAITVRVPVASVSVSPASDTIFPRTTVNLAATPRDSAGHPLEDRAVTWRSSNPAVATVTAMGVVTGVAEGQAAVSAVVEGTQGTAAITVHIPATAVNVTPALDTLFAADTVQLAATVWDSVGNSLPGRVVAWMSSDPSVVTVSPAGLALAVAPGTATITATAEGKSGNARIVVRALNVTGEWAFVAHYGTCDYNGCYDVFTTTGSVVFTQNGTSLTATAGWVDVLSDGAPSDGAPTYAVDSGSTPPLFTLDGCVFSGSVRGDSMSGTHNCADWDANWSAVRAGPVISLGVQLGQQVIVVGETTWLRGVPRDAAGHQLFAHRPTFSSGNPSVATASDYGFVKGLGSGTAAITAAVAGVTGAAQVTVRSIGLTAVTAADGHACALTNDGAAWCWGSNDQGQLGDGSTAASLAPVPVAGGLTFTMLSAGAYNTCGLAPDGAAYCWGWNDVGQLGDGSTTNRFAPVAVSGGRQFASVSTGVAHACALTASGSAYCWGLNGSGQLGNGTTANSLTPVAVSGGLTFAAVSAGSTHTCGVTTGAVAYCWGENLWGELGDGSTTNRRTPVPVGGSLTFASVSAGSSMTCGVAAAGTAYCWGFNRGTTPGAIAGGLNFASISTGAPWPMSSTGTPTCAIAASGAAYCWGSRWVGDGSSNGNTTPVAVAGGLTFASVSAGAPTCGHATDGRVYCWGSNTGDGTSAVRLVPVRVLGQP